jgi:hypothetical protein
VEYVNILAYPISTLLTALWIPGGVSDFLVHNNMQTWHLQHKITRARDVDLMCLLPIEAEKCVI